MNRSENRETQHSPRRSVDHADAQEGDSAPFVAKLIEPSKSMENAASSAESDPAQDVPIRIGSPFRIDPPGLPETTAGDDQKLATPEPNFGDFGPFRYTAMGASTAAVLVLIFAALGTWWFPAGGALVAVLGSVLSIIGLFSADRFRYMAITALPLHMGLFFLSYARSLG